jgi:hypothetical protein
MTPAHDVRDRRDVADEIEVQFFVEHGVDRVRRVGQKQYVAVGGYTHDRFGRDIGASASVHQRRGRAPKTPTLLDVLRLRGRLKLQNHERALPRVLDSNLRVTASQTRIVGGGTMSKRNLVIEEGSVEAMARLQKQDEEFCRRLRAAIETGRECCPTTIFTEPCKNRPVSNYMRPDYRAS